MTGATYINFDTALNKGKRLIKSGSNPNFGLYIICGINFGLRAGDLLSLTFDQLRSEEFTIIEQKTGKTRKLKVNNHVREAVESFKDDMTYQLGGKAFTSQKGSVYSIQHINRMIKGAFSGDRISSHSLRKSFGRRVWENDNHSDRALGFLNELFNHTTYAVTKRYLGIRQEELDDVYMNL
ncbi:tyrosine-type recombinase/integrase [Sediminicola sp. 1XM1-17]|uniref:tyrosine-type recombinase/integrase n=1 Tax=Sediminicola sp. 1XM1-17 TaxID=3127702 RepID=UPI00307714FD